MKLSTNADVRKIQQNPAHVVHTCFLQNNTNTNLNANNRYKTVEGDMPSRSGKLAVRKDSGAKTTSVGGLLSGVHRGLFGCVDLVFINQRSS